MRTSEETLTTPKIIHFQLLLSVSRVHLSACCGFLMCCESADKSSNASRCSAKGAATKLFLLGTALKRPGLCRFRTRLVGLSRAAMHLNLRFQYPAFSTRTVADTETSCAARSNTNTQIARLIARHSGVVRPSYPALTPVCFTSPVTGAANKKTGQGLGKSWRAAWGEQAQTDCATQL